jgi:type I restriction enzyme S subunit
MNGWKLKTIDEVAEIVAGVPAPNETFETGDYPFVRMKHLGEKHLSVSFFPNAEYVTKAQKLPVTKAETILIPRSGSVHLNHRAVLKKDAVIVSHICGLVAKEDIDTNFFYYQLCQFDMTQIMTQTTGLNAISFSELRKVSFVFPNNKSEQSCIAKILSLVDEAITQTEALITKYQRIKTGLMQDLLTKGIDENGNIRSEATHEFKDSPLGRIPKDWEEKELSTCVKASITYGIVQAGPHVENGIPYIRTGDMAGDSLIVKEMLRTSPSIAGSFKRSEVHTGEIVFALRATVGEVLEVPSDLDGANLTQGTARIAPSDKVSNNFLLWMMRTEVVKNQIELVKKGTTFFEITLGDLREIRVFIPKNKKEQEAIAKSLDLQEQSIASKKCLLAKLKSLKKGLMQDLLTGKVSVDSLLAEREAVNA